MAITLVGSDDASTPSAASLDIGVPVGTTDGDLLVVTVTTMLNTEQLTPPDVAAWSRVSTFPYLGHYAGDWTEVWVATYESSMGAVLTFTKAPPDVDLLWAAVVQSFRADNGFLPVQYCWQVAVEYNAAHVYPDTWPFPDWFDTVPYADIYNTFKAGIGADSVLVYCIGFLGNSVDPPTPPVINAPSGSTDKAEQDSSSGPYWVYAAQAIDTGPKTQGTGPIEWDITTDPHGIDEYHSVGLWLTERGARRGFVFGHSAWGG